jgi:hypothetical protein
MALISVSVPNMLNGVSQQTPGLRFSTQAEAQENGYSSPVEGLGKRPPTEHVASLITGSAGSSYVHVIDRGDGTERYAVVIRNGSIKVFDTLGAEKTVTVASGASSYLTTVANAETVFKAVSIGDYTFILNREKVPALQSTTTAAAVNEALIWVRQGAYGTRYQVKGDLTGEYTSGASALHSGATNALSTVDGETFPSGTHWTDAIYIAAQLKGTFSGTGFTHTRQGYTIHTTRTSTFDITVEDGVSGNGLGLIKDSVQSFADLPSVAKDGMIVKVEGLPDSFQDDYYVKFESTNGTNIGDGLWIETIGPGVKYLFDYTTMPHVLIRQSDGTFIFKQADGVTPGSGVPVGADYSKAKWAPRETGDDNTNSSPSFVGQAINDIFLFKGRLGFLAGESIIMSEVSQFFNFWRTTVTALLDSDPVDVSSAYPSITIFRSAIPFSERLVVFSDQTQFILSGTPILSPGTAVLSVISNYDCLNRPRPAVAGESIFFAFDRGGYSGVREMIANPDDTTLLQSPDISAQIPKYITGKIIQLSASTHDNVMVALADGDRGSLYVYKWLNSQDSRVQSSWSKWTFSGGTILGATWSKSELFLVIQRSQGVYLEKVVVEPNRRDQFSQFVTALDRRIDQSQFVSLSYSSVTDKTTIVLPYQVASAGRLRVAQKATISGEGGYLYTIDTVTAGSATIVVNGNLTGVNVWVGETYDFRYEFSIPYLKQEADGARAAYASGRFQLRNMSIIYSRTSQFKARVTNRLNSIMYEYVFTGNVLGTGLGIIGTTPVHDGTYRFPIYGKNDEMKVEIVNDSHLPSSFLSAEYESSYDTRSQRT